MTTSTDNKFLDAALEYASYGWRVFPLRPKSKEPITSHGFKDATTDTSVIAEWWRKTPDANVAIATGDGLVVVDVDDKPEKHGGVYGSETLRDWELDHGDISETVTAKSGTGGMHYYFNVGADRVPICESSSISIDLRGDGGYIVAPPSIHPDTGKPYAWDVSPEDMPPAKVSSTDKELIDWVYRNRDGAAKVDKGQRFELPDVIHDGTRDMTIFRLASSMRSRNNSYDATLAACRAENLARCKPPLDDKTVVEKVNSAWRYEPNAPVSFSDDAVIIDMPSDVRDRFDAVGFTKDKITDKNLGRLFADLNRDKLAYVPEEKALYAYNGVLWTKHGAEQIAHQLMKDFTDKLTVFFTAMQLNGLGGDCLKAFTRYQSFTARKHLLDDAVSELVVHSSEFNKNANLLNVENATIEFNGPEVVAREHRHEDMVTYVAPVSYDPLASCDKFVDVINKCCDGDVELVEYIQKQFGKTIAGDVSDDNFHILGERPRTGKGTIMTALFHMLGAGVDGYAKKAQGETFAAIKNRNGSSSSGDRMRLKGARLILTTETNDGLELDAAFIKEATGGDPITARFNYKDDEQFYITGKIFMTTNHFPTISDPSIFGSGRVRVIPFNHQLPENEQDTSIRNKVMKDPRVLSGLLNWCIEGYKACMAHGCAVPDAVKDATSDYMRRMDVVSLYIDERLEPCDNSKVKATAIYADYAAWSASSHHATVPRKEFLSRMKSQVTVKDKDYIVYDGKKKQERNVVVGYAIV